MRLIVLLAFSLFSPSLRAAGPGCANPLSATVSGSPQKVSITGNLDACAPQNPLAGYGPAGAPNGFVPDATAGFTVYDSLANPHSMFMAYRQVYSSGGPKQWRWSLHELNAGPVPNSTAWTEAGPGNLVAAGGPIAFNPSGTLADNGNSGNDIAVSMALTNGAASPFEFSLWLGTDNYFLYLYDSGLRDGLSGDACCVLPTPVPPAPTHPACGAVLSAQITPGATPQVEIKGNLNACLPLNLWGGGYGAGVFIPDASLDFRVHDSLGHGHDFRMSFEKTDAAPQWRWYVNEITGGANPTGANEVSNGGPLTFNGDGTLASNGNGGIDINLTLALVNGAYEPWNIRLNFGTENDVDGLTGNPCCWTPTPTPTPGSDELVFDSDDASQWSVLAPPDCCANFSANDSSQNHTPGGAESGLDSVGDMAGFRSPYTRQTTDYAYLEFWLFPTDPNFGGVQIDLLGPSYPGAPEDTVLVDSATVGGWQLGAWNHVFVPLSQFESATNGFDGFFIHFNPSASGQPCFVDDIRLMAGPIPTSTPSTTRTPSPSETPTLTPSHTPSATPSPSSSPSDIPSPTWTGTVTPSSTTSPTLSPTPSPSPVDSATFSPTPSTTPSPCPACAAILPSLPGSLAAALPSENPSAPAPSRPLSILVANGAGLAAAPISAGIYSQAGQLVSEPGCFTCSGPTFVYQWDGFAGGSLAPNGVYFFMVDLGSAGKKSTPLYVLR